VYFGEFWWFITNLNYARKNHKILKTEREPNLSRRKESCSLYVSSLSYKSPLEYRVELPQSQLRWNINITVTPMPEPEIPFLPLLLLPPGSACPFSILMYSPSLKEISVSRCRLVFMVAKQSINSFLLGNPTSLLHSTAFTRVLNNLLFFSRMLRILPILSSNSNSINLSLTSSTTQLTQLRSTLSVFSRPSNISRT